MRFSHIVLLTALLVALGLPKLEASPFSFYELEQPTVIFDYNCDCDLKPVVDFDAPIKWKTSDTQTKTGTHAGKRTGRTYTLAASTLTTKMRKVYKPPSNRALHCTV